MLYFSLAQLSPKPRYFLFFRIWRAKGRDFQCAKKLAEAPFLALAKNKIYSAR